MPTLFSLIWGLVAYLGVKTYSLSCSLGRPPDELGCSSSFTGMLDQDAWLWAGVIAFITMGLSYTRGPDPKVSAPGPGAPSPQHKTRQAHHVDDDDDFDWGSSKDLMRKMTDPSHPEYALYHPEDDYAFSRRFTDDMLPSSYGLGVNTLDQDPSGIGDHDMGDIHGHSGFDDRF